MLPNAINFWDDSWKGWYKGMSASQLTDCGCGRHLRFCNLLVPSLPGSAPTPARRWLKSPTRPHHTMSFWEAAGGLWAFFLGIGPCAVLAEISFSCPPAPPLILAGNDPSAKLDKYLAVVNNQASIIISNNKTTFSPKRLRLLVSLVRPSMWDWVPSKRILRGQGPGPKLHNVSSTASKSQPSRIPKFSSSHSGSDLVFGDWAGAPAPTGV